jgi:hypothetical protein
VLTHGQPDSEWAWRFRLLRGDILIAQLRLSDVQPILGASLPGGHPFDRLRARQKYLEAKAQVSRGQLPDALETLTQALSSAPAEWDDVRMDAEVLGGQVRLRTRALVE